MKQLNEQKPPEEPSPPERRKNDTLWKVVMEELFDDLLRFLFPDADRVFDLKRGFEFLDKELAEMYPGSGKTSGAVFADKLVKVFNRDGQEECVLCHIEVQGETKAKDRSLFAQRMFRYFYRIWDRYRKPVSALAVFTGRDAKKMPDCFEYTYRNTQVLYKFPVISILDYTDEELEKSDNPFAQVMLAARTSLLEGKITEQEMLERKILIARQLLKKGFPKEKIKAIFRFLEKYVRFKNPEMNRIFKQSIQIHDKSNVMNFDEYIKMEGKEEGLKEGRKIGAEKKSRLFVKNLLTDTRFSVKKIASLACVTEAFVKKVQKELSILPS